MSDNNIKRYSLEELRTKDRNGESKTDWTRLDTMTEEEIERLANEDDKELGVTWDWDKAQIVLPEPKQAVNLRLDAEILRYFRQQGPGYQTRINAVLKSYVNAQLEKKASST